jgi:hypothetical protein
MAAAPLRINPASSGAKLRRQECIYRLFHLRAPRQARIIAPTGAHLSLYAGAFRKGPALNAIS